VVKLTKSKVERPDDYEPPYFWATGAGFYKGKYPPWFDVTDSPVAKLLEDNYEAIKAEVLEYYEQRGSEMRPNWLPYGYSTEGWLTADLYSFGMRTKSNCEKFPFLDQIVRSIPGMMLAQVAVLQPGTVVRPHIGETSAVIRCHLPLVVPGTAPDLGMRVGAETRCWEEGKVFALNIAYRHRAWNLTDKPRVVVVVDYINPDFADRQHEVEAGALAWLAMKGLANAVKPLKRMPPQITRPIHAVIAAGFRVLLAVQRRLDVSWTGLVSRRPQGRRRRLVADAPTV
jgi:ornithine lipid ester-linked acyl 2-hydroxylase